MASSSHIAPKEKGEIKARVSTAGRRGTISKRISVFSNDTKNPRIMLTVIAEIVPPETSQNPIQPSGSSIKPLQERPKVPNQKTHSTQ